MAFASGFGAAASGTEIPIQQTLQDSVQSLQWSPTANLLCAGGWNGEVGSFLFLSRRARRGSPPLFAASTHACIVGFQHDALDCARIVAHAQS